MNSEKVNFKTWITEFKNSAFEVIEKPDYDIREMAFNRHYNKLMEELNNVIIRNPKDQKIINGVLIMKEFLDKIKKILFRKINKEEKLKILNKIFNEYK